MHRKSVWLLVVWVVTCTEYKGKMKENCAKSETETCQEQPGNVEFKEKTFKKRAEAEKYAQDKKDKGDCEGVMIQGHR